MNECLPRLCSTDSERPGYRRQSEFSKEQPLRLRPIFLDHALRVLVHPTRSILEIQFGPRVQVGPKRISACPRPSTHRHIDLYVFYSRVRNNCLRGHRVAGSFPCFYTALEHFDVGKAFRPIFGCLTDSARFGGSRSIENDFLRLRQRSQPRSEIGQ